MDHVRIESYLRSHDIKVFWREGTATLLALWPMYQQGTGEICPGL